MVTTRLQFSAGGVICRRDDANGIDVVLISTNEGRRWGLPKGLIRTGESPEEAALRETSEETGLEAEIMEPLEPIEYWYVGHEGKGQVRFHKRVYFYLMRSLGGDTSQHDWEIDEARWVPLEEAIGLASFDTERRLLEQVKERVGAAG